MAIETTPNALILSKNTNHFHDKFKENKHLKDSLFAKEKLSLFDKAWYKILNFLKTCGFTYSAIKTIEIAFMKSRSNNSEVKRSDLKDIVDNLKVDEKYDHELKMLQQEFNNILNSIENETQSDNTTNYNSEKDKRGIDNNNKEVVSDSSSRENSNVTPKFNNPSKGNNSKIVTYNIEEAGAEKEHEIIFKQSGNTDIPNNQVVNKEDAYGLAYLDKYLEEGAKFYQKVQKLQKGGCVLQENTTNHVEGENHVEEPNWQKTSPTNMPTTKTQTTKPVIDSKDSKIEKIKKLQAYVRGWLVRERLPIIEKIKCEEDASSKIYNKVPIVEWKLEGNRIGHADIRTYNNNKRSNICDIKFRSKIPTYTKSENPNNLKIISGGEKSVIIDKTSGIVKGTYTYVPTEVATTKDKSSGTYTVPTDGDRREFYYQSLHAIYEINYKHGEVFVIPSRNIIIEKPEAIKDDKDLSKKDTGVKVTVEEYTKYAGEDVLRAMKHNSSLTFTIKDFAVIIKACYDLYKDHGFILSDFKLENLLYEPSLNAQKKLSIIDFMTSMNHLEKFKVHDESLPYTPCNTYYYKKDSDKNSFNTRSLNPNNFWYTFLVGTLFRSVNNKIVYEFYTDLTSMNSLAHQTKCSNEKYRKYTEILVNREDGAIRDWCKVSGITNSNDVSNIIKLLKDPSDPSIKDLYNEFPRILLEKSKG